MIALTSVMASCGSDAVVKTEADDLDNMISFTTYSNLAKGDPVDDNDEFMDGTHDFGVVAFIDGKEVPYMGSTTAGAKIVYNSAWEHDDSADSRYWPSSSYPLDFFAYSPHDDGGRSVSVTIDSEDGITINGYTVDSDISTHEDFMYASTLDATMPETDIKSVNLHFQHGLVQVHFLGNTITDNMYVDIAEDGITLFNVNSVGDFSLPITGTDDASWDNQSTLTSYTLSSNAITFGGDTTSNTTITLADKSAMLIPQTFSAWNTEGTLAADDENQTGAYVTIKSRIYTADSDSAENVDKLFLVGDSTNYVTIYVPIASDMGGGAWEAGKNINFAMSFGGGYDVNGNPILEPISFTTKVTDWGVIYPGTDI